MWFGKSEVPVKLQQQLVRPGSQRMNRLEPLFESLQRRPRPEDVAELVLEALGETLRPQEKALLEKVAATSFKRGLHQFSSMLEEFQRPVPPSAQTAKAAELFQEIPKLSTEASADPDQVAALIAQLSATLCKTVGANDFKADRLNEEQRKLAGLDISKRRYNKLFRFLLRFERKLACYQMEQRKYAATRIAKAGLVTLIRWEDFCTSPDAACFIAYYAAARNRRSIFTNQGQASAYDEVAAMLLNRFRQAPVAPSWYAIAQIMPDPDVVAHLENTEKWTLFTDYLAQLEEISSLLQVTWQKSNFNRDSMIVKRGDDSTTWNALAGAWNTVRSGWLSLAYALGMEQLVNEVCLGKVMRLMAADVAAWHRLSGGSLDPDTAVWAALPAPWDVLSGQAICTKVDVETTCKQHGVDPVAKGWIAPKETRQSAPFIPTPELVHGVAVGHPALAAAMKRAGWFSGKTTSRHP
ncbi:hypothetical protein SAMN02745857_02886 [Andreprevotia lacus DSM 23236]|jgi:hypothetical protein|uniref:Uncharacterized protein n=1 Tax=Andreprevotia lacus DSM 23236 TaxID=1121001 RepID=A0A1W1XU53_9NEIS|nr:hypothetical protein [Andreprevotia lacus]SMC27510.1 hypothetical protein SAMN02745857_02886 [Andreprevotia lacus DSM 23236]